MFNTIKTEESRRGKYEVPVDVVPKNADISIEGMGKVERGFVYLTEGTYKIHFSKDGYENEVKEVVVKKDLYPRAYSVLKPISEEAKNEYNASLNDRLAIEGRASEQSRSFTETYENKYPAAKLLPYKDPYYQIGYLSTDGTDFYITVYTESPRYRHSALKKIRSLGIDPTNYKIVFMDYKSPLKEAL